MDGINGLVRNVRSKLVQFLIRHVSVSPVYYHISKPKSVLTLSIGFVIS